jgi:signal transduction histidine kinase
MTLNVPVREDILTSWQRCVVAGLRPDHFEVPYQPDFDRDGPLRWAAAPCAARALSEQGLEPAVKALARRSRAYYIVSEALANVAKHANAQMVMISVEAGRGVLSLSVRDDGVGGADPDGSGLTGLRERAEALGGTLRLTSPPGRGTRVDVRLPGAAR